MAVGKATMENLLETTRFSVGWTFRAQVIRQGGQFISTAVLARLILPSEFGVVSMAYVFIGFLQLFSDFGFGPALIQRRDVDDVLIGSCLWMNIIIGAMLVFLTVFLAPLAADFYHQPEVRPVLVAISLSFPLASVSTVQQALLEKEMNFKFVALADIGSAIVSTFGSIVLALLGFGVWSLVGRALLSAIVKSGVLLTKTRVNQLIRFSPRRLKPVLSFSLNMTGFNVVNYFARNADNLLIGKFLGAQDLGYYNIAYQLMLYPLIYVTGLVGRVLYPVLVKFQDNLQRFRDIYLKSNRLIAFVTFPLMMGLFGVADDFILGIFGPKWSPAINVVKILAWVGLVQSIVSLVGNIYQSFNRMGVMFVWSLFATAGAVVSFIIGLRWGIVGVSFAYAVISYVLVIPGLKIPFRLIDLPFTAVVREVAGTMLSSLLMLAVVLLLRQAILAPSGMQPAFMLVVEVSVGVVSYAFISRLVNSRQVREVLAVLPARYQRFFAWV